MLLAQRGRKVVVLTSGDPFWFGAGHGLTRDLDPGEWTAHPAPSTFGLVAARLGWAIQDCTCLGLHAAPLQRLGMEQQTLMSGHLTEVGDLIIERRSLLRRAHGWIMDIYMMRKPASG